LQNINGYQVLRRVAESNTAEIFHVRRLVGKGKGVELALKALRPEFSKSRQEREYLQNEFRICSAMDHVNVIRVHEVQLTTDRPFITMDLVSGPSLRDMIAKERIPLARTLDCAAQAAEGLAYVHEQGCVHRDVKPQNIVVGDNGNVKVIDFALAISQDRSLYGYLMRRLTEWRRPGTWSYMSPEQIRHKRLTGMADLYSLGVSLFQAVTGQFPYAGETPQALLEQHLYGKIPSLLSLQPETPMELDELVQSMLAKDPLDRPAGMRYVSGKLRSLIPALRKSPGVGSKT
jgi:eukaryotic-like serine/threonine-protein kinase